jgi:hypothetical protein
MATNKPLLPVDISRLLNEVATTEYPLNNQLYEIEIYITNGSTVYTIAPTTIVSLSIEESLSTWVAQGSMVVNYSNELAEFLDGFQFRNDGEDLLRIRLIPRDLNILGLPSLKINKKLWELNYVFAIYNVDDVTPQTGGNSPAQVLKKYKKFYFWDVRYQVMSTRNIEYSTAYSNRTDLNREVNTGNAIYEIIKTGLNNDSILSKTGLDVNASEEWDNGDENTRIFYTSPASTNCYEDLTYVYSRHVSSTKFGLLDSSNDYCLLTIEKDDGLGYFALKPVSRYFENAGVDTPGKYQIEHFFLHADAKQTNSVGMYRSPINLNSNNNTRDLSFRDYSSITKYEFVDVAPAINASEFVTTPVYSFDFKNRRFNVEFQQNSVEAAEKTFSENYINNLYQHKGSGSSNFLMRNTNSSKLAKYNVRPVFSLYGNSDDTSKTALRLPDGLHRLLYTGLFQNTCINFTVPGITLREPGRFIAIDRPEGSEDKSFDDKLCGQWFVINVTHTISNGAYYNNITAVKVHRFKPASIDLTTGINNNNIFKLS